MPLEIVALGRVDRSAVLRSPLAHSLQDVNRFLRYRTIRLGTDIQQIVAAAASAGDEIVDNRLGRFPVIVGFVVSPTVIEGHAGFPGASLVSRSNLLLGRGKVSRQ